MSEPVDIEAREKIARLETKVEANGLILSKVAEDVATLLDVLNQGKGAWIISVKIWGALVFSVAAITALIHLVGNWFTPHITLK